MSKFSDDFLNKLDNSLHAFNYTVDLSNMLEWVHESKN